MEYIYNNFYFLFTYLLKNKDMLLVAHANTVDGLTEYWFRFLKIPFSILNLDLSDSSYELKINPPSENPFTLYNSIFLFRNKIKQINNINDFILIYINISSDLIIFIIID